MKDRIKKAASNLKANLKNAAQGASGRRVETARQQTLSAKRERDRALKEGRTGDASRANKAATVAESQYAAGSMRRALPLGTDKQVKKAMTTQGRKTRRAMKQKD